jgi:hypothetical protein
MNNQFNMLTAASGVRIETVVNSFKIVKDLLANDLTKQFHSQLIEMESKLNAAL